MQNGIFYRFWLDHNKLRFYRTCKTCFKAEPHVELVQSRNQLSNLTYIRTSTQSLEVEVLRYKIPSVPYSERYCRYCTQQVPGNEEHFLMFCETFIYQRQCSIGKLKSLDPAVSNFNSENLIKSMLCPTTTHDDCWLRVCTPCLTIAGPSAPGRTAQVILGQPLLMLLCLKMLVEVE